MGYNLILLLNALGLLAVSSASLLYLIKLQKRKEHGLVNALAVNSVLYLGYCILNLLWFSGSIAPAEKDSAFIAGIFFILHSLIFLFLAYSITKDRNLVYIFLIFILTSAAIPFNIVVFLSIVSLGSFLVIGLSSFDLYPAPGRNSRKAGIIVLSYSLLSIIFIILALKHAPWFIAHFLMAYAIFLLASGEELSSGYQKPRIRVKEPAALLLFLRFVLFILLITSFALISTVTIHEFGHSIAAQYYGCESAKAVVYDSGGMPYSEIICTGYYNETVITLAGIMLPIIAALVLFLLGGRFAANLSSVIIGIALIISSMDYQDLGLSQSSIFLLVFSGFAVMIFGIVKISSDYVQQKGGLYEDKRVQRALEYPEKNFWIDQERPVSSLYTLLDELNQMKRSEYWSFMHSRKSELLSWINYTLREKELSGNLRKNYGKKQFKRIIVRHLLKKLKKGARKK